MSTTSNPTRSTPCGRSRKELDDLLKESNYGENERAFKANFFMGDRGVGPDPLPRCALCGRAIGDHPFSPEQRPESKPQSLHSNSIILPPGNSLTRPVDCAPQGRTPTPTAGGRSSNAASQAGSQSDPASGVQQHRFSQQNPNSATSNVLTPMETASAGDGASLGPANADSIADQGSQPDPPSKASSKYSQRLQGLINQSSSNHVDPVQSIPTTRSAPAPRPSEFAPDAFRFTYELTVTYTTEIRQHFGDKLRWTLGSHEHVIKTRWVKELPSGKAVLEIKVTCRNEFINSVHKEIENLLGGDERQDIPRIESGETLRVGKGLLVHDPSSENFRTAAAQRSLMAKDGTQEHYPAPDNCGKQNSGTGNGGN